MKLNLAQKTALITGGTRGIGFAIAHNLASEGANLILVAREKENGNRVAAELQKKYGVKVEFIAADITHTQTMGKLLKHADEVDILINNAGSIPSGSIDDIKEETWRQAWELKLFGYINMMREFYAVMRKRKHGGVILNIIGGAAVRKDPNYIAGVGANSALEAITISLGSTSIDNGIRILGISPGYVQTDRVITLLSKRAEKEYGDKSRWREYLASQPLGRCATPEEVADLAAFLVSERASYISGTIHYIDGGALNRVKLF